MYEKFDVEDNKNAGNLKKQNENQQDNPVVYPYYEEYLDPEQRGTRLPFILRLWRNRCIIALILQTTASLTGLVMYSIRRIRIGQIVNIICIFLILFFGKGGVLSLNKMHVAVHGVVKQLVIYIIYFTYHFQLIKLTSSVFGVIFLYSMLEVLFIQDIEEQEREKTMLIIFCLPYLIDFAAGLCMLYLAYILFELEKDEVKIDIPQINLRDNEICVICCSKKINTVFYTCGHKAACYECSLQIKKSYKMECPLCRKEIKDLIVIYEQ